MTALNDSPLNALSEHVHALNTTFDQLFKTIDEQIDAIIMQDVVRIESLTEKHAALHGSFRSREKAFVDELQRCIPADQRESVPLSLTGLKSLYPQYTMFLEEWQDALARNIKWLQRHQGQLVQLLEFAQRQNSAMMRAMYTLETEKSAHYSHTGQKATFSSGIAVNQEA
ncbi:MAG: flagella secretion chaperone FlgN [Bacteroidetes bacterium HLUCCA01]|nr:MAG: flagella secretion chaperone FlgN [Bacteroidetes bacterium HLUCCA01]